jgi:hypothetical protein
VESRGLLLEISNIIYENGKKNGREGQNSSDNDMAMMSFLSPMSRRCELVSSSKDSNMFKFFLLP